MLHKNDLKIKYLNKILHLSNKNQIATHQMYLHLLLFKNKKISKARIILNNLKAGLTLSKIANLIIHL